MNKDKSQKRKNNNINKTELWNIFDTEVENRRELMESEIKSNVKHSLHTIFKNLSDETI